MANPLSLVEFFRHLVACMLFGFAFGEWALPAFFRAPANFLGVLLRLVWAWSICCIISPILPTFIYIGIFFLFVVFAPLIEIVIDEIYAYNHKSDQEPQIVDLDHDDFTWEYVARLKSSNNGCNSSQFYPVTLVDFNELDDPLYPHASIVYLVEIRRRCLLWKTIIIWQVSVINGGRKKMHEFQMCNRWTDANLWTERNMWTDANLFGRKFEVSDDNVRCFQSNGVIFVAIYKYYQPRQPWPWCASTLVCIYDIRNGSRASWRIGGIQRPVSICCLGRLVKEDKTVYGWRIRWSSGGWEETNVPDRIRARITHTVYDLGETTAFPLSRESLLFGNFDDDDESAPVLQFLRSSQGYFGLAAKGEDDEEFRVILFDPRSGQFVLNLTEGEMRQSDRQYNAHATLLQYKRGMNRCPMVLSGRECIDCFNDGTVFRAQFKPPTLKYGTAKQLFHQIPGLRYRMNAKEFREIFGIDGMNAHFD